MLVEALRRKDDEIDRLYSAIKRYLAQVSREALEANEARRWTEIIQFTINLEHIGDIIERLLLDIAAAQDPAQAFVLRRRHERDQRPARAACRRICSLAVAVFFNGDLKSAQQLIAEKVAFRELELRYADHHLHRLFENTQQSVETSSLHLDLLSDFKRINSLICSVVVPNSRVCWGLGEDACDGRAAAGLFNTKAPAASAVPSDGIGADEIEPLFTAKGDRMYAGEPVTQLQHALQSAQLAEQSGADAALIVAALLHDLGHMVNDQGETPTLRGIDDRHEYVALPFLRGLFDDTVLAADPVARRCKAIPVRPWRWLVNGAEYWAQLVGRLKAQPRATGRDFRRFGGKSLHLHNRTPKGRSAFAFGTTRRRLQTRRHRRLRTIWNLARTIALRR